MGDIQTEWKDSDWSQYNRPGCAWGCWNLVPSIQLMVSEKQCCFLAQWVPDFPCCCLWLAAAVW